MLKPRKKKGNYKVSAKEPDPLKPTSCIVSSQRVGVRRWAFESPDKPSAPITYVIPPHLLEDYLSSGLTAEKFMLMHCTNSDGEHESEPEKPQTPNIKLIREVLRDKTERLACEYMARRLDGILEFSLPVGRVDVLTESTVFEVKQAHNWKHALGQVLVYGAYFPDRSKAVVLVGRVDSHIDLARAHCEKFNVSVIPFFEFQPSTTIIKRKQNHV